MQGSEKVDFARQENAPVLNVLWQPEEKVGEFCFYSVDGACTCGSSESAIKLILMFRFYKRFLSHSQFF